MLSADFQSMNSAGLRKIVKDRLNFDNDDHSGDFFMNPDFKDIIIKRENKAAAVLIPFIERESGLKVLLTKRAERLNSHSGQIAFPGGKIDDDDDNAEAAALREAEEEIALQRAEAEVIGRLPDYFSGSGFRISPILSLVSGSAIFEPNPDEVDYVFEVPFAFLMDENNHKKGSRMFQGKERFYLEMPYKEHHIWGVTAGIIRLMHDRLRGL